MSAHPSEAVELDGNDEEYVTDMHDRTGLPDIPVGYPSKGDKIDIGKIQDAFNSRPTKRSSPTTSSQPSFSSSAAASTPVIPASVPMKTFSSSSSSSSRLQDDDEDIDDIYSYQPPERRMTHKKLPRKTAFTAAFLLFVGVVFSTLGLSFLFTLGLNDALPFLIIGGIAFIPGSYVSFIIYHTWKGTPGYSYDQIPSYDD